MHRLVLVVLTLSLPAVAPAQRPSEVALRTRDIAFYAARARRDPQGAADLARVSALFLQRARETGDVRDYRRAEDAARRSLANRNWRNGAARLVLASSLLAQHGFPDALVEARSLCALYPDEVGYRALLGEIELEMGQYEAAAATFTSLAGAHRSLAVAPRLARWAEIQGRPEEARALLAGARAEAARRRDLPREQVAWFHLRHGDLELRHGRLAEAEDALRAGLAVVPNDPRLLGALARVEAARGRWRRAIAYGQRAGAGADIQALAVIGDAWAALGEPARAESAFAAAERAGIERPEPFNRQWTQFLLDHRRRLPETLALLREEIAVRQDIYGYDQLAWALYLNREPRAARAAMAQALRMGTRDSMLARHARLIAGPTPSR